VDSFLHLVHYTLYVYFRRSTHCHKELHL